jgi:hypothetical protein
VKRKTQLPWRRIDGEGVVLSTTKDEAHILNETALLIWEMLDGRHTIAEMAERVASEYSVPKKSALADVNQFVRALRSKDLIE